MKHDYYFGGPVPREIQERLEACRDRGMRNQDIARKLAYLFLALPEEKQNQLYMSTLDTEWSVNDRVTADLLKCVDDFITGQLVAYLPNTAAIVKSFVEAQSRESRRPDKQSQIQSRQHRRKTGA